MVIASHGVFHNLCSRLKNNQHGVALIEFAYTLPVILVLGFVGLETANFAIAHQKVSQIASLTADNASRLRTQMTEGFVNQLFTGAEKAGTSMLFKQNGRIILSSVQNNAAETGQWIRWQRCFGAKADVSKYGAQGKGQTDTSLQDVKTLKAMPGSAIMLVEATYQYQSVVPGSFLQGREIRYESAFIVRQRTDFSISGTTTAACPAV